MRVMLQYNPIRLMAHCLQLLIALCHSALLLEDLNHDFIPIGHVQAFLTCSFLTFSSVGFQRFRLSVSSLLFHSILTFSFVRFLHVFGKSQTGVNLIGPADLVWCWQMSNILNRNFGFSHTFVCTYASTSVVVYSSGLRPCKYVRSYVRTYVRTYARTYYHT